MDCVWLGSLLRPWYTHAGVPYAQFAHRKPTEHWTHAHQVRTARKFPDMPINPAQRKILLSKHLQALERLSRLLPQDGLSTRDATVHVKSD